MLSVVSLLFTFTLPEKSVHIKKSGLQIRLRPESGSCVPSNAYGVS